ncbi:N-6 DNA methylase [Blastococcus sp. SYSU DS0552]
MTALEVPLLKTELPRYSKSPAYLSERRLRGAYYTPDSAATFMADWVIRRDGDRILEPSFGAGVFLQELKTAGARRNLKLDVTGVELDPPTAAAAVAAGLVASDRVRVADFLQLSHSGVDAIVGNPPYVRLRHLSAEARLTALRVSEEALGAPMDPSGSLWMPFVLHATERLRPEGRVALVLPYDFTYVRYARPLWDYLAQRFASLRILRSHERLFPEILQDVVILLADGFGGRTNVVEFEAYETVHELTTGEPAIAESIAIADVVRGERAFLEALLPQALRVLMHEKLVSATVRARELVTFNIGYVAGDKNFFHPDRSTAKKYGLPSRHLVPALTSARALRRAGIYTSDLKSEQLSQLYLPSPDGQLEPGERAYVLHGEQEKVNDRYKCRIRKPWYVVPGVRVPDVCISVFSERPTLFVNDGKYVASNSLLCGYLREGTATEMAARWFTSLTLLQCELEVHALGGGVMVLVPREAGNIRLPRNVGIDHLNSVDLALSRGDTRLAFKAGDAAVLERGLGLSRAEVELVQEGAAVLAHWRTSARAS